MQPVASYDERVVSLREKLANVSGQSFQLKGTVERVIWGWLGEGPFTVSVHEISDISRIDIVHTNRPNVGIGINVGIGEILVNECAGTDSYPVDWLGGRSLDLTEKLVAALELKP